MDFQKEVIDKSFEVPVLVDFWAPWCGPCRVLGPVIEELESDSGGDWVLVKINTEEAPEIAQEFGIRSIPNVKLFSKGKVIEEFSGALPKFQIQQWLNQHLPTAEAEEWVTLQKTLEGANNETQKELLQQFVLNRPEHVESRHMLGRLIAFSDPASAKELVSDLKMSDPGYEIVEDINTLVELSDLDESETDPLIIALRRASKAISSQSFDEAANIIIDVVSKNKMIVEELPRRAGVALFRLLGNHHPVSKKYRRTFDMWLY